MFIIKYIGKILIVSTICGGSSVFTRRCKKFNYFESEFLSDSR